MTKIQRLTELVYHYESCLKEKNYPCIHAYFKIKLEECKKELARAKKKR
jgi:hypothetical protein